MTRRDERRQVSSGRASEETARRFKGELRREVGDLEVRLEEAQLRSDALLHAGLTTEAAQVLQESRQLVDDFHGRLTTALAAAAVEREAERIFAGSIDVIDVLGADGHADAPRGGFARLPAGVGAAIASVAVLALAALNLRAPVERDVQIAAADLALPSPDVEKTPQQAAADRISLTWMMGTLSSAELEVLSASSEPATVGPLLEQRRRLLDRLAQTGQPVGATVLAELDRLVERLVREGVDVDRLMELERVQREQAERAGDQPTPPAEPEGPAEPDAPTDGQPDGQPAGESAEPSDDPSEPDDHVFPFDDQPDDGAGDDADASGSDSGDKGDGGGLLDG